MVVTTATIHDSSPRFGHTISGANDAGSSDGKFQMLADDISRDFSTVDVTMKSIDEKLRHLRDLSEQFTPRSKTHSAITNVTETVFGRLEQISRKCDTILEKLEHQSVDVLFRQLIVISEKLETLSKHAMVFGNEMLAFKTAVEQYTKETPKTRHKFKTKRLSRDKIVENQLNRENLQSAVQSEAIVEEKTPLKHDRTHFETRLKDPKILNTVRMYLAFLHNQPSSVCYDGLTNTSAKILLALEGFPTDVNELRQMYTEIYETNGMSKESVLADLSTYRSFIATERIQRMQRARESSDKFYGRQNPKRD